MVYSTETMDVITNYLENSSIHGVGFISKTKASRRAFWFFVVVSGFTGAFTIIYQNFQNWAETPVTTTMETLPITKITFPKVTICPPPNTYTNLNYDLVKYGNITMTDDVEDKDEDSDTNVEAEEKVLNMMSALLEKVADSDYEQALMLSFEEANKYKNWYDGWL